MKTIILLAVTIFISLQFVCNVSCNITVNLSAANRIVNGKAAKIADFPYQLSLRRNTVHMCGASVLSTQWAITAAHCIHGFDKSPTMFSLRAGSNMRLTGGTVIYISTIFEHPSYNADTMNYDVALLRTKPNILRGDFITPIKLPNTNDVIPQNTEAIVSGWGHMSSSENVLSKDLKYTVVNIYNQELCNESLKSQGGITDAMFCAAARNTDACQGDSGGPIQINGTLVGIVSWGVGCADPYYPGVYTRLTHAGIRLWVRVITHL